MALTCDYVIQNNELPCQRGFEPHLLYQHRIPGYPPIPPPILQFRYVFFPRLAKKRTDPRRLQIPINTYKRLTVASEFSNLEGTTKQTKLNEWLVHILHTMLARVVCNCDNTLPDSTKRALMGKKLQ